VDSAAHGEASGDGDGHGYEEADDSEGEDDYVIIGDRMSTWFQSTLCQPAAHGISKRDESVLEDVDLLREIHAAQQGQCVSCSHSLISIDDDLLGMHNR
jgi:hypothetical protein